MAPKIATARITFSASKIDFADDTLADEIARTFTDAADEFMAGNAFETHVAFKDLQISGADTGEMNLDDCALRAACFSATARCAGDPRFSILDPRPRTGWRIGCMEAQLMTIPVKGAHVCGMSSQLLSGWAHFVSGCGISSPST
jgi:hypothetical protein